MKTRVKCVRCQDTFWVCEWHDDRPWDGEHACGCGGAGMPCPSCNVSNPDSPPRLPAGFQRDESLVTGSLLVWRTCEVGSLTCTRIASRA
jgi:hypothetical protein